MEPHQELAVCHEVVRDCAQRHLLETPICAKALCGMLKAMLRLGTLIDCKLATGCSCAGFNAANDVVQAQRACSRCTMDVASGASLCLDSSCSQLQKQQHNHPQ